MKRFASLLPLLVSLVVPAVAADKKKPQEPGISRGQAEEILQELRQIRQLLEKGARPGSPAAVLEAGGKVRMRLENETWLGKPDAPLTLVEFTDYQCGFCQQFHLETFPALRKKYIDSGQVRFVSRDLPLDFHSSAARAAEAARCAGDQGQFWTMRDRLVANPGRLSPADVTGYARDLKLNLEAFQSCLSSGKYRQAVENDVALAASINIQGTPAFILGKSTPEGVEGVILMGALPLEAFEAKLADLSR
jgi:protein-disulfide isomerase